MEDRALVNNLTDANMNLMIQVVEHANNMAKKDAAMAKMQKTIIQLQGEIKTLKSKLSVLVNNKPDTSSYKKGNWWSKTYCWV